MSDAKPMRRRPKANAAPEPARPPPQAAAGNNAVAGNSGGLGGNYLVAAAAVLILGAVLYFVLGSATPSHPSYDQAAHIGTEEQAEA